MIDLLFSVLITAVAYMIIPTFVLIFTKKPLSSKTRTSIVVINGALFYFLFRYAEFRAGVEVQSSVVPALFYSSINNYLLKNKSNKLLGVERPIKKKFSESLKENMDIIPIATVVIIVSIIIIYFVKFFRT